MANSQTVAQIIITSGGSAINLNANGASSLVLNTGNLSRTGGVLNVTLPTGGPSATNGVRTTASNVNGIVGGFAVVGGADWAMNVGDTHVAPGVNVGDPGTWDAEGAFSGGLTQLSVYTSSLTPLVAGTPISFNTSTDPTANVTAGNIYYVGILSGPTGVGTNQYFTVSTTPDGGTLVTPLNGATSGTLSIDSQGNLQAYTAYTAYANPVLTP